MQRRHGGEAMSVPGMATRLRMAATRRDCRIAAGEGTAYEAGKSAGGK